MRFAEFNAGLVKGQECILIFKVFPTSANIIDLLGRSGVGLGRLHLALLCKVKDCGENHRYRSVLLALTILVLTSANLIDL